MKKLFRFVLLIFILFSYNSTLHPDTELANLTIQFTGMTPHVGQIIYIRVIDKGTMKESGRIWDHITVADFEITLDAVTAGRSYFIDFFADHNNNSFYDPPPTDHAWRLELNNAAGNDVVAFAHNTNFTDIDWEYLLLVQFTGMTPHVGQLLELRVKDNANQKEIGRFKLAAIPAQSFNVTLPGLKLNGDYNIDFYADLNGNGRYDVPPADHAWRIQFTNTTGNHTQPFEHNTNFTEIGWTYLTTLNLTAMVPHVGQLFEMRVVDQKSSVEIGRVLVQEILLANFSVEVPGTIFGNYYDIDFYADHNGSGGYNAPPVDHAWRLTYTSSGDYTADFTHNTVFTDIQWPPATSVDDDFTPNEFRLSQNYPNPFNPSTIISFSIPVKSEVTVKIFDILGNEIATLVNEVKDAGSYSINFNAFKFSSGVYFYSIRSGDFYQTKKMTLMK